MNAHPRNRPIGSADIDHSYRLLHLLDVLAHASRSLDNAGEKEVNRLCGSIAACIDIAHEIAGELHDLMDFNRADRGGVDA